MDVIILVVKFIFLFKFSNVDRFMFNETCSVSIRGLFISQHNNDQIVNVLAHVNRNKLHTQRYILQTGLNLPQSEKIKLITSLIIVHRNPLSDYITTSLRYKVIDWW